MRALLAIVPAAALLLGGMLVAASPAEAPARASALALVAGGTAGVAGDADAAGDADRRREVADVSLPGLTIKRGEAIARTSLTGGDSTAFAVVAARTVSVLDGLVTAYGVRREARTTGGKLRRHGLVRGLHIAGQNLGDIPDSTTIDLPDHSGRVIVNNGTIGLRVVLSRDAHGYPKGTDIRVAAVQVDAIDGAAPAPAATPVPAPATPKAASKSRKRRKAPNVRKRLTRSGYAFPVYGEASVADDWGAARQIGAHQGNDIFAPFGAPVLAVAGGVVEKVGTLPISGNRLWLRTTGGDEFFYAHLSAFSPAAVNGRRVKAGTVLGFTGNTGDAEPTPPHVHFEIHPGGGDAIDPHEILLAWQQREDVAPGAWLQRYGADTTERPGALVEVRDFIAGE